MALKKFLKMTVVLLTTLVGFTTVDAKEMTVMDWLKETGQASLYTEIGGEVKWVVISARMHDTGNPNYNPITLYRAEEVAQALLDNGYKLSMLPPIDGEWTGCHINVEVRLWQTDVQCGKKIHTFWRHTEKQSTEYAALANAWLMGIDPICDDDGMLTFKLKNLMMECLPDEE